MNDLETLSWSDIVEKVNAYDSGVLQQLAVVLDQELLNALFGRTDLGYAFFETDMQADDPAYCQVILVKLILFYLITQDSKLAEVVWLDDYDDIVLQLLPGLVSEDFTALNHLVMQFGYRSFAESQYPVFYPEVALETMTHSKLKTPETQDLLANLPDRLVAQILKLISIKYPDFATRFCRNYGASVGPKYSEHLDKLFQKDLPDDVVTALQDWLCSGERVVVDPFLALYAEFEPLSLYWDRWVRVGTVSRCDAVRKQLVKLVSSGITALLKLDDKQRKKCFLRLSNETKQIVITRLKRLVNLSSDQRRWINLLVVQLEAMV